MKSMARKVVSLGAATAMAVGGASVATADIAHTTACTARAGLPNASNNAYVGRDGCSSNQYGTGWVKEDRTRWPDSTVGVRTFSGGMAWVNGSCGNGEGSYYSEYESSSGASAQSERRRRC